MRGSWHAKEREAEGEMKPETGRPVDPAFRNDDDKRAWEQLLDQLEAIPGLLTIIDGPQLERYSRYLVRWRQIENELEGFKGLIRGSLANDDLRQVVRLLWNESRAMDLHLKQIEDKFGLNPSARTRIRLMHNVGDEAAANAKNVSDKSKKRFFNKQA